MNIENIKSITHFLFGMQQIKLSRKLIFLWIATPLLLSAAFIFLWMHLFDLSSLPILMAKALNTLYYLALIVFIAFYYIFIPKGIGEAKARLKEEQIARIFSKDYLQHYNKPILFSLIELELNNSITISYITDIPYQDWLDLEDQINREFNCRLVGDKVACIYPAILKPYGLHRIILTAKHGYNPPTHMELYDEDETISE